MKKMSKNIRFKKKHGGKNEPDKKSRNPDFRM